MPSSMSILTLPSPPPFIRLPTLPTVLLFAVHRLLQSDQRVTDTPPRRLVLQGPLLKLEEYAFLRRIQVRVRALDWTH